MPALFDVGDLVSYKARSGITAAKVIDVIPDIDQTYYALRVTSRNHPQYTYGVELLVPVSSDLIKFKSKPKPPPPLRNECLYGHEYTEDNTYYEVGELRTGVRRCRQCLRRQKNKWYARKVGKDNGSPLH